MLDHDKYYTPPRVASRVANALGVHDIAVCADTACGDGSLLRAVERRFPRVQCVGMDRDHLAVRKLRRQRPHWVLSIGDTLSARSRASSSMFAFRGACDAIVANPPFSMGQAKGVVRPDGRRCSLAMAHLLASLQTLDPGGAAVAILPESSMYSEMDEVARCELRANWTIEILGGMKNSTFRGARANALLVRLERRTRWASRALGLEGRFEGIARPRLSCRVARGGLPVHEAHEDEEGIPYIHSTGIGAVNAGAIFKLRRVRPIPRGLVIGPCVLLPRVGVPSMAPLRVALLRREAQLSDCVIALRFSDVKSARIAVAILNRQLASLQRTYVGTGARFVTVARLASWLSRVGIEPRTQG